jgi:hypothetical protein
LILLTKGTFILEEFLFILVSIQKLYL